MNSCNCDDKFKAKFKYYKSKQPKPSLEGVLSDNNPRQKVTPQYLNHSEDPRTSLIGLKPQSTWSSYIFDDHPGLILIRNPFTTTGQKYWIRQCLENYPKKPNKKNIDFELEVADWWNECHRDRNCNEVLQKKLRWTTLGYHHDWDTKLYAEENQSPFPEDLAELSDVVATYLGFTFKAEAAIVNYYHMDSTLAPHTDHSECNLDAPLFSFSFGQSAIFLIGGQDKSIDPSAILLQSGDIVVMSKQARLCYHAVPKILRADYTPWIEDIQSINNDALVENSERDEDNPQMNISQIENGSSIINDAKTDKKIEIVNYDRNINKNFEIETKISDTKINKKVTESVHTKRNGNENSSEFDNNKIRKMQTNEKLTEVVQTSNDASKVNKNLESSNNLADNVHTSYNLADNVHTSNDLANNIHTSNNLADNVHTSNPSIELYGYYNNDTSKRVRLKYIKESQLQTLMNASYLEESWQKFADYLQESRINMNVRQVLNDNQKCLTDVLLN